MWRVSNRRGFTLLELVISAAIIAIISTIMFGDYAKKNQIALTRQAANQIMVDLQKMYTYAQAGHKETGVITAGYGLSFQSVNPTFYYLFFDRGDAGYPLRGICDNNDCTGELLVNRKMPSGIRILNMTITDPKYNSGDPYTTTRLDLAFQIPGASLLANSWVGPVVTDGRLVVMVQNIKRPSLVNCVSITPVVGAINLITCP